MITIQQIKNSVSDWLPVLSIFGVPELPQKKEGPCIFCGGKTRARWITQKQYYFCNQCEKRSRDGFAVIQEYNGWTVPETVNELSQYLGLKETKETNYKQHKRKLKAEKENYLKAMQDHLLAETHKKPLTEKEIEKWDRALVVILKFRNAYPNYLEVAGI